MPPGVRTSTAIEPVGLEGSGRGEVVGLPTGAARAAQLDGHVLGRAVARGQRTFGPRTGQREAPAAFAGDRHVRVARHVAKSRHARKDVGAAFEGERRVGAGDDAASLEGQHDPFALAR